MLSVTCVDVSLQREQKTSYHAARLHRLAQIPRHYDREILNKYGRHDRRAEDRRCAKTNTHEPKLINEALDAAEYGVEQNIVKHSSFEELFFFVLFVCDGEYDE